MIEQTTTGYRVTDEGIAFWESRDTCPSCGAVTEPAGKTETGANKYECRCDGEPVRWTR